ncbi:MAG TPA: 4Fe-4S dicluster domain-containing protein [Desulfatirhabdiaceae bacterium]|nr:4Fe-4S dicluster domain-containing protein [Desulfatirhabdiaceae bacterium]
MKYWRVPLDSDDVCVTAGRVYIISERCKGCGYCIEYCPRDVLAFSEGFNAKGYHPPVVKRDDCLNCHYCELLCPEFAIFSVPEAASISPTGLPDIPAGITSLP